MDAEHDLGAALDSSGFKFDASQVRHLWDNDRLASIALCLLFDWEIINRMFRKISEPIFNRQEGIGVKRMTCHGMGVSWEWAGDEYAPSWIVGGAWVLSRSHHA